VLRKRGNQFAEYVRAFRRREAFMALSTMQADKEASPVGVRMVGPKLEAANRTAVADCDFKVLPSNDLGGYGQYYAGSLIQLGLTNHENGIDLVTPEAGEALALASTRWLRTRHTYEKHAGTNPKLTSRKYNNRLLISAWTPFHSPSH
jgi:hypothetical protein